MSPPIQTGEHDDRSLRKALEDIDQKLEKQNVELAILKERLPSDLKVRMAQTEQTLAAHKWGLRAVGGGVLAALGGVLYKLISGGSGPHGGQ